MKPSLPFGSKKSLVPSELAPRQENSLSSKPTDPLPTKGSIQQPSIEQKSQGSYGQQPPLMKKASGERQIQN